MTHRVVVDEDLCQGHGVCESEAPEVFEVGPERTVLVLTEVIDDDSLPAASMAVKYCPTHALSLQETENTSLQETENTSLQETENTSLQETENTENR